MYFKPKEVRNPRQYPIIMEWAAQVPRSLLRISLQGVRLGAQTASEG